MIRTTLLAMPFLLAACDSGNNAQAVKQETSAIEAETKKLKSDNAALRAAVLDVCAQAKRVGLIGLPIDTANTLRRECPSGYFD